MTIEKDLVRLRENIAKLSYAADNCDIVMTNEFTSNIMFDLRTITLGKALSKQENEEYQKVLAEHHNAKVKLLECDCKKK
jgi:hypothetical protein